VAQSLSEDALRRDAVMRLLTKEKRKRFNRDTYCDIFVWRRQMSSWRWKLATAVVISMLLLNLAAVQSQPAVTQSGDQSGLLSTVYVPPNNFGFQEIYDLLRQHNALKKGKGDTQSVPVARAVDH
jgi:hypothetical protein